VTLFVGEFRGAGNQKLFAQYGAASRTGLFIVRPHNLQAAHMVAPFAALPGFLIVHIER
jgi:hypothetical protein